MIDLFFVGDGPRDGASLPPLVSRIVGRKVGDAFKAWKEFRLNSTKAKLGRVNSGDSGYDRKLLFAIAQARLEHRQGLIAVVDRDKFPPGSRLAELERARKQHRERPAPYLPVALGEAVPHVDVWLLDDPQAVRTALFLKGSHQISSIKRVRDPKEHLDQLIAISRYVGVERIEPLAEIARNLDPTRCLCRQETGFTAFIDEVTAEFRDLLKVTGHNL